MPFAIPSNTFLRDSTNLVASAVMIFDPIWGGDGEPMIIDWTGRVYLRDVLQGFAGINELLLAFVIANLLSLCSNICGHLLDDSNTLCLDLLEALHQLKQLSTFFFSGQT